NGARAQLRARDRVRHGALAPLHLDAGGVLMPAAVLAATTSKLDYPLLTFLVFLPAIGAIVAMLTPARRPELARATGYATSVATFGLAVFLLTQFDTAPGYQLVESHQWISSLGISWTLGVDGISLFMVALSALLFPIGILASARIDKAKQF